MRMLWCDRGKATKLTFSKSAKPMDLEGLGFPRRGLAPLPRRRPELGDAIAARVRAPDRRASWVQGRKARESWNEVGDPSAGGEREDLPVAAAAAAMVRGGTRCYRASGVQEDGRVRAPTARSFGVANWRPSEEEAGVPSRRVGGVAVAGGVEIAARRRWWWRRRRRGAGEGEWILISELWDLNSAGDADCLRGKVCGAGLSGSRRAVTVEPFVPSRRPTPLLRSVARSRDISPFRSVAQPISSHPDATPKSRDGTELASSPGRRRRPTRARPLHSFSPWTSTSCPKDPGLQGVDKSSSTPSSRVLVHGGVAKRGIRWTTERKGSVGVPVHARITGVTGGKEDLPAAAETMDGGSGEEDACGIRWRRSDEGAGAGSPWAPATETASREDGGLGCPAAEH
nr:unnamed protein product [Digitaria exilis]